MRDGEPRVVGVEEVVVGDLVRARRPATAWSPTGRSSSRPGSRLDESILTGESRPVTRAVSEEVRSGSYAVEGAGAFVVSAVGPESYAQRIAGEARQFRHPRSPLERSLNRLLFVLVAVMIPLGTIFIYSLWQRDIAIHDAVTTAVAGIVTLVPEGLILLASLTFAAAALQLARRGALAQQLNAIESLASVDVDLPGQDRDADRSRSAGRLVPGGERRRPGRGAARGRAVRVELAGANRTLEAIAVRRRRAAEEPGEYVPFSSARRWSGLRLGDTSYVLGAPERFPLGELAAVALARAGGRAPRGRVRHGDGSAERERRPARRAPAARARRPVGGSCAPTRARRSSSSATRASSCA